MFSEILYLLGWCLLPWIPFNATYLNQSNERLHHPETFFSFMMSLLANHASSYRDSNGAFPLQHVARFKRAVPNPARFFWVVPAQGYFFAFFLASKIEVLTGPTTGLNMLN